MNTIIWKGSVDAAHFIPGHPKCGRLHGHTYTVTVELMGIVPKGQPYLCDYGKIKEIVHKMDHRILIPTSFNREPFNLVVSKDPGNCTIIKWDDFGRDLSMRLHEDMVCLVSASDTSAEELSAWLVRNFTHIQGVEEITVSVQETPNTCAKASWTKQQ